MLADCSDALVVGAALEPPPELDALVVAVLLAFEELPQAATVSPMTATNTAVHLGFEIFTCLSLPQRYLLSCSFSLFASLDCYYKPI